jgi:ATP-dependent Lon protease
VIVSELLPDTLNILPFEPRPIFPNVLTPFTFSGEQYFELIQDSWENQNRLLGIALVKQENSENFFHSELHEVGTVLKIYKVNVPAEGIVQILAQGLQRFSRVRSRQRDPFPRWEVKYHYDTPDKPDEEQKAYALAIMSAVRDLLKLSPVLQEPVKMMLAQMTYDNITPLMDVISSILGSDPEKLQDLLGTFDMRQRSEKLLLLLKEELEVMAIQEKIQKQITEKVNKQQKDFFLREQLKAIKQELGLEKDDKTTEIDKFQSRLKKLKLSEEAEKVIHEELEKLGMMEAHSAEYQVTRNYLDTLTALPWGIYSRDNLNIAKARRILNQSHYGLDEVKQRILELISTIRKRGSLTGQILCLVGPPGVGKSSIGRSIAAALQREFFRFSLGGMRDEAEIKGHRRTYIGALPGKIIQAIRRTGTANPVIMLDEIDKLGASFRGDPASALLEVLDPELNVDYLDHYLDVRFDLSKVLFITTANQLDTIPEPLLDRMEIIRLSGYILEEKLQIAKKYLIPRQREAHGLNEQEFQLSNGALRQIIDGYAREAGVRNLENQLKKIMSAVTLKIAEKDGEHFHVSLRDLEKYLGKPRFRAEEAYPHPEPGVATGLAWTALGGAILHIEAVARRAKGGGFQLTGQLGDIMKESAQIAYTCVRALLDHDSKHKNFFEQHQIHLHVPEGATPKDGPSAGITMALALYSLATDQALTRKAGMTGELTLTGKVLPIGGVREKTIAAKRAGIFELILPEANRRDFEELPAYIRKGLNIYFVKQFAEVLALMITAPES